MCFFNFAVVETTSTPPQKKTEAVTVHADITGSGEGKLFSYIIHDKYFNMFLSYSAPRRSSCYLDHFTHFLRVLVVVACSLYGKKAIVYVRGAGRYSPQYQLFLFLLSLHVVLSKNKQVIQFQTTRLFFL